MVFLVVPGSEEVHGPVHDAQRCWDVQGPTLSLAEEWLINPFLRSNDEQMRSKSDVSSAYAA